MEITQRNIELLARKEFSIPLAMWVEFYREMGRSVKIKFRSPDKGGSAEVTYLSKKLLKALPEPEDL